MNQFVIRAIRNYVKPYFYFVLNFIILHKKPYQLSFPTSTNNCRQLYARNLANTLQVFVEHHLFVDFSSIKIRLTFSLCFAKITQHIDFDHQTGVIQRFQFFKPGCPYRIICQKIFCNCSLDNSFDFFPSANWLKHQNSFRMAEKCLNHFKQHIFCMFC